MPRPHWKDAIEEAVRGCLAQSADPNARIENGWTPLYVAAAFGHADTIEALLDAGVDGSAKNRHGKTPFDIAKEKRTLGEKI